MTEINDNRQPKSLFLYIIDHLDKNGCYDAAPLADAPERPYSYGAEDAALFHPKAEDGDLEEAKNVYLLLKAWMQDPSVKTKQLLYAKLRSIRVITVFFPLAAQLRGEKLPFDLLHLAQEWLYTAADREVLKFVYLLCGLLNLEHVRKSYSENLYRDLFTVARCEEFTIFLCMACQLSDVRPQKELWYLARRTSGWGKALLLVMLNYNTPSQQDWLLKNGLDMKILWPSLAPVVIKESRLFQLLQQEQIDSETYNAAAKAIITYLMLLAPAEGMPEPGFEQSLDMPIQIALTPLLQEFLRHARHYAVTPKSLLTIFAIRDRLELLSTEKDGAFLNPNETQRLIGLCDSLIYTKNWEPEIRSGLFDSNGDLAPDIVDFAADIGIDIWPSVMEFFNSHPKNVVALRYLMFAEDWDNESRTATRRQLFLECAEAHIADYINEEDILVNLAHYLQNFPGEGSLILTTCLTSIYEHARAIAAISLSHWPKEALTPAIKTAVIQAIHLNDNPFIAAMLESLLSDPPPTSPKLDQAREQK